MTKYYTSTPLSAGFAGASRIAMRTGSALTYLLGDHLGSTSLTTDDLGNFVSELRYKPWGETRYSSGTTATSYRYTGQREEVSFGLYFYNARWYDPYLNQTDLRSYFGGLSFKSLKIFLPAPPAVDEGDVVEQLQNGGDEAGDVGERGGVEDVVDAAHFFVGLDDAGLGKQLLRAG